LRPNTADEDEEPNGHYDIDEKSRSISLTEMGLAEVEKRIPEIDHEAGDSLYDPRFYHLTYYLDNALRAQYLFKRDVDYVVQGDEVVIVDDFTGRLMPGRRYSDGLHEAIEAKEGVNVKRETVTVATITLQNYFRLYDKLAGMTGTALTDAEEFDKIYELGVTPLPTNVEYIIDTGQMGLETRARRWTARRSHRLRQAADGRAGLLQARRLRRPGVWHRPGQGPGDHQRDQAPSTPRAGPFSSAPRRWSTRR
jgi:preprotein translocase subunit SecA